LKAKIDEYCKDNLDKIEKESGSLALKKEEIKHIEEITITVYNNNNQKIMNDGFQIIDIPGIDDAGCRADIETFINKNKESILPLFVIDSV
jgi:hypothetical protein